MPCGTWLNRTKTSKSQQTTNRVTQHESTVSQETQHLGPRVEQPFRCVLFWNDGFIPPPSTESSPRFRLQRSHNSSAAAHTCFRLSRLVAHALRSCSMASLQRLAACSNTCAACGRVSHRLIGSFCVAQCFAEYRNHSRQRHRIWPSRCVALVPLSKERRTSSSAARRVY
jgi:hypothetical protein